MAWQTELIIIVRYLIDDTNSSSYKYSDSTLRELILVAAQFVKTRATFLYSYEIDVDAIEMDPDPTDDTRDESFINLVCLKAACIVQKNEAKLAAGKGWLLKDGRTTIDGRTRSDNLVKLLGEGSICGEFDKLLLEYKITKAAGVGSTIFTPIRREMSGWYASNRGSYN